MRIVGQFESVREILQRKGVVEYLADFGENDFAILAILLNLARVVETIDCYAAAAVVDASAWRVDVALDKKLVQAMAIVATQRIDAVHQRGGLFYARATHAIGNVAAQFGPPTRIAANNALHLLSIKFSSLSGVSFAKRLLVDGGGVGREHVYLLLQRYDFIDKKHQAQPPTRYCACFVSQFPDSNRGPTHYECVALPTEPNWQFFRLQK